MLDEVLGEYTTQILAVIISLFMISFIAVGVSYEGEKGILNILGIIPTDETTDGQVHVTPDNLSAYTANPPEVILKNGIYVANSCISFGGMFNITVDGVLYDGAENGNGTFSIAINSVIDENKREILLCITQEEYEEMEDVSLSMFYDEEQDYIYFLSPGLYKITFTVHVVGGAKGQYTVVIPIE